MQISNDLLEILANEIIVQLRNDNEPLESFKVVNGFLDKLILKQATFTDDNTSHYFFKDFLGGITKLILSSVHFHNDDVDSIIITIDDKRNCLLSNEHIQVICP